MAKKKAKKELDLADILAGELNKQSKDSKVAFFLNDDEAPTNVDGWISTGCAMLDVAVSNRPYGGLPVGRITEITGLEQSGKSLVWKKTKHRKRRYWHHADVIERNIWHYITERKSLSDQVRS